MRAFLFGYGALLDATADRLQQLADKHGVRFVREETRFRVEADTGSSGSAMFTRALKRDEGFYEKLQQEASLSDGDGGNEDGNSAGDDDIPW